MRRNRNMGRGGGRGNLNMSGGPLITEHLKDIDLELELLKRKREMFEQQQQQFLQPFNQPAARNFNQQPYYRVQNERSDANRDFSHLYNDGPQQYRKPFGKKRQSDSVWQNDPFPKRPSGPGPRGPSFTGPSPVRNPRPYSGPSHQPKGFKYGQGKSVGQKIANQKQQHKGPKNGGSNKNSGSNKNGVANKIVKPTKASATPNKLAAQPVADRSNLVAAAIKSVAEVESRERESLRLLSHKEPTKQMTGRLELALGAILRDIREKCAESQHEELLRTAALQRVIKQAIRDRIRAAMLGKVVGATVEIIKEYRSMYPKETDIEIVNKALEAASVAPEKPANISAIVAEKARPDSFYKENMCILIDLHLQEMFDKIDEIYNPPEEKQPEKTAEVDFTEDVAATDTAETDKETKNQENIDTNNQENMDTSNQEKEIAKESTKSAESGEADNKGNAEESTNPSTSRSAAGRKLHKNPEELIVKLANANPNDYKRLLPRLLKRHIPSILKMLQINKMYRSAVADLTSATRNKYMDYAKTVYSPSATTEYDVTNQKATAAMTPTPTKGLPPLLLPYYVKVMGKPQLPKKKVMQAFLEVFHPKSIKKHRNIHNLLFIGFSEKSDFEAIVQADGTVLGRSTLQIRACDKNANKPEENADNSAVADKSADQSVEENKDNSDIIGADLDGQITELLTSIRNTEDSAKDQKENKTVDAKEDEATDNGGSMSVDDGLDNIDELAKDDNDDTTKVEASNETENTKPASSPAKEASEKDNKDAKIETSNESVKAEANDHESAKAEANDHESAKAEANDHESAKAEANDHESAKAEANEHESAKAEANDHESAKAEANDQVSELKNAGTAACGRSTPTRASTRLASAPATPSSIRTRRASRLMQ